MARAAQTAGATPSAPSLLTRCATCTRLRAAAGDRTAVQAATGFLQGAALSAREAVQQLVAAAAAACGSEVTFYAVPGGRGSTSVEVRGDAQERRDGFRLVCSSRAGAEPGARPPEEDGAAAALRACLGLPAGGPLAANSPAAGAAAAQAVGRCVAAAVRTSSGIEGALLVRARSPSELLQPPASSPAVEKPLARAAALEGAARLLQEEAAAIQAGQLSGDEPRSLQEMAAMMDAITSEYVALLEAHPMAVRGGETELLPCTARELVAAAGLWSLVLAERLESLRWQSEAQAAVRVCAGTLRAVERLGAVGADGDIEASRAAMLEVAQAVLPEEAIRGGVSLEHVELWSYDQKAGELVLDNSGQLDGVRIPARGSLAGHAATASENSVIYAEDVAAANKRYGGGVRAGPVLCVPLAPYAAVDDTSTIRLNTEVVCTAVVQFSRHCLQEEKADPGSKQPVRPADHFDLVAAEALGCSILPLALRMRSRVLRWLEANQEQEALKMVVADLNDTLTVTEFVRVVESDIPRVLDCERCTFYFVHEEHGEIWAPPNESFPEGIRMGIGEGFAGQAVQAALDSGESAECIIISNDPSSCPHWTGDIEPGFVTRSLLTAPIWSAAKEGQLLGLIQLVNKQAAALDPYQGAGSDMAAGFGARDRELLKAFMRECAFHMHRLVLDMMWTKAEMEMQGANLKTAEVPSLVKEYYAMQHARGSKRTIFQGHEDMANTGLLKGRGTHALEATDNFVPVLSLSTILHDGFTVAERADIHQWGIDYWALSEQDEYKLVLQALRQFQVFDDLDVPTTALHDYFQAVRSRYNQNPYHNFHHAISTVHYVFKFTDVSGVTSLLTKEHLFALVIGSLVHDCDHRGRNNAFEVMTRGELALRYNDSSVLENHSCALAFELALKGDDNPCNIFADLAAESFAAVRKQMVAGILSTDMKYHGTHVTLMQDFKLEAEDRAAQNQFLVEVLLHAADIANPLMPQDISARWGQAVAEEFAQQAETEEQLGLPVTAFMRGLQNPEAAAKSQLGFMDFVIQPFFSSIFHSFPELSDPKTFLEENRDCIVRILDPQGGAGLGMSRRL